MTAVKTAISLQEPLFRKLEELAGELELPRSRVLAMALEEYIARRENQKLLDALNEAYQDDDQADDLAFMERHLKTYAEMTKGDW